MSTFRDEYDDVRIGWWLLISIPTGIVILSLLAMGMRQLDRHFGANQCKRFAEETHRIVRFVDYSYWSYDCITPSKNGKWISTAVLTKVEVE